MALAARQHGVVTRAQMRRSGLTDASIRWRVGAGTLELVVNGVYRVGGATRSWEQRLAAACLWGGPGACASHRAAGALWGFEGFSPGPVEISTLKQNRARLPFKVHRTQVDPAMVTAKLGIPVTNAFRTVLDLVNLVDEHRGNQLLDEALRKGLVSMEALWRFVRRESRPGRRGVGKLRRLLEQRDPDYQLSASEFQAAVRALLVGAGLTFTEEHVVTDREGRFVARVDFLLDDAPVVIEADGRTTHSSRLDWEHDLERRNGITAQGLAVIHVTRDRLRDHPDELLAEIFETRQRQLRRRGVAGPWPASPGAQVRGRPPSGGQGCPCPS
jgi:very-short-patch-repair endonuclease